jgi:hypothetical protein
LETRRERRFIYHFVHSYVATPVSVEAEFHYRVIAQELGLATMPGASGKSHIYIFEKPEDWKLFQGNAHLEPWTGGIHSCGSLFLVRDPGYKFANNSLGHEIAHLILFRVYQRPLPRWLDEGFAEYVSRVARASYQRARNYNARPHSQSIPADQLIPLSRLTTLVDYPASGEIDVFYHESERLVRFLAGVDQLAFRALLDAVAHGESFDTALSRHYSGRFFDVAALERNLSHTHRRTRGLLQRLNKRFCFAAGTSAKFVRYLFNNEIRRPGHRGRAGRGAGRNLRGMNSPVWQTSKSASIVSRVDENQSRPQKRQRLRCRRLR